MDARKNSMFIFNLLCYYYVFNDHHSRFYHLTFPSSIHVSIIQSMHAIYKKSSFILIIINYLPFALNFISREKSFHFESDAALRICDHHIFSRILSSHRRRINFIMDVDDALDYKEAMDEDNHHTIDDWNDTSPSFDSIANHLLDSESDLTDDDVELTIPRFECVCIGDHIQQQLAHRPNVRPSHDVIKSEFSTEKEGNI